MSEPRPGGHRWVAALSWLTYCVRCNVTRRTALSQKCPHVHPDRH